MIFQIERPGEAFLTAHDVVASGVRELLRQSAERGLQAGGSAGGRGLETGPGRPNTATI